MKWSCNNCGSEKWTAVERDGRTVRRCADCEAVCQCEIKVKRND